MNVEQSKIEDRRSDFNRLVLRTNEEVGDALAEGGFVGWGIVVGGAGGAELAFGAGLGDEGVLGFFAELLELNLFVLGGEFPLIGLGGELMDFEVVAGQG